VEHCRGRTGVRREVEFFYLPSEKAESTEISTHDVGAINRRGEHGIRLECTGQVGQRTNCQHGKPPVVFASDPGDEGCGGGLVIARVTRASDHGDVRTPGVSEKFTGLRVYQVFRAIAKCGRHSNHLYGVATEEHEQSESVVYFMAGKPHGVVAVHEHGSSALR